MESLNDLLDPTLLQHPQGKQLEERCRSLPLQEIDPLEATSGIMTAEQMHERCRLVACNNAAYIKEKERFCDWCGAPIAYFSIIPPSQTVRVTPFSVRCNCEGATKARAELAQRMELEARVREHDASEISETNSERTMRMLARAGVPQPAIDAAICSKVGMSGTLMKFAREWTRGSAGVYKTFSTTPASEQAAMFLGTLLIRLAKDGMTITARYLSHVTFNSNVTPLPSERVAFTEPFRKCDLLLIDGLHLMHQNKWKATALRDILCTRVERGLTTVIFSSLTLDEQRQKLSAIAEIGTELADALDAIASANARG